MSIVRGRLHSFALPLVEPLRTGHGVVGAREGFLVEFSDDAGNSGYGEALPLPSFGGEGLDRCREVLLAALRAAVRGEPQPPGATGSRAAPVARAAVECARLDLAARASGVGFASLLGDGGSTDTVSEASVPVNGLVAGDDAEAVARSVAALADCGFGTWKLKVGVAPVDADIERVRALRASIGASGRIRLDANGVWSAVQAREALARFAEFDIEWVEQPIAPGDDIALAKLRRDAPVRIAADESVVGSEALRLLLDAEAVDAVALKLPVLGGPRAALELGRLAIARGVCVYVTSFLDSSLGIRCAANVAALLGEEGTAHGLATASLLARDLVEPLPVRGGRLRLPSAAGLGAAPDRAVLDASSEAVFEVRA